MPLINCKVELKLKWTIYCALSAAGADNADANSNIIFTIKDTKLYVPVITLSAKDNQKLLKFPHTGFKRSVYWNKYKTKSEKKSTTKEYRYFLESVFLGVKRLFVLTYSNQDDNAKRYQDRSYHLPEGIIKNCNVIINRNNFYYDKIFRKFTIFSLHLV